MRLFNASATNFISNGIGRLADAISCYVTQELNGEFELQMVYPVDGRRFSDLVLRNIIVSKVDRVSNEQAFRIYRISKPMNGKITVYARHISYDMSGIIIEPFTAGSLGAALQALSTHAVTAHNFTFATDKSVASSTSIDSPRTLWSMMGGSSGSILDAYGGEWEFDNQTAFLWQTRGQNRGVQIRYGKNLTSLEQDSNCASVYTGIYPYWKETEGDTLVTVAGKIVSAGTFDYQRILPVDFTADFETEPTPEELLQRAQRYIAANSIGVPAVSWTVEFAQLEKTEEYKGKALLESVFLGDTVTVKFEKMGVDASARAVKIKYNAISERYESVTLGKVKSNLAETIVTQKKEIESKPSKTIVERIAEALSDSILNAAGGYVRLIDTNEDGFADELYIADAYDPAEAVKVWRFNYQGWAASSSGYNGPFTMGATLDNGLLANFVTAAQLKAGTIQSADGKSFYLNLDENVLQMQLVSNLESSVETRITGVETATETRVQAAEQTAAADLANATNSLDGRVTQVETDVSASLQPLNELLNYLQVGNIGGGLYGVKIGKVDAVNAFKSVFTAEALEFYQSNVRTAFLSNQKLNANTIRTGAMQLVDPDHISDEAAVDWEISLDNGFAIKYVGG